MNQWIEVKMIRTDQWGVTVTGRKAWALSFGAFRAYRILEAVITTEEFETAVRDYEPTWNGTAMEVKPETLIEVLERHGTQIGTSYIR